MAVVVSGDDTVLEAVLAACATVDLSPRVVDDAEEARADWASATAVIVGADRAEAVAQLVLPRRTGVYVVGTAEQHAALCAWSVPLGASVIALPDGASWLTSTLAEARGGRGAGTVLAVTGGCGGVGASTLAAGLAWTAVRQGRSTILVDLDHLGGGLDLLLGAERMDGWRWSRLVGARGHLGDLRGQVPALDGLDLLPMDRGDDAHEPTVEAVTAVLGACAATHQLTVIDAGRGATPGAREAIRRAEVTVLLIGEEVRALAAAHQVGLQIRPLARELRLVVRGGPVSAAPSVAAELLDQPVIGRLPHDSRLPEAARRGDPPGRGNRLRWRKSCARLLDALVPAGSNGPRGEQG